MKVIIDILEANDIKIEGLFDNDISIKTLMDYLVFHTKKLRDPLIISVGEGTWIGTGVTIIQGIKLVNGVLLVQDPLSQKIFRIT